MRALEKDFRVGADQSSRWWWALVLLGPVVVKLLLLRVDVLFEPHAMALEWIGSGQLRYYYLGQWDHAFQFPVYTLVIAGIYALGLGPLSVLAFQVGCATLGAWLVGRLALLLLNGRPYAQRVALITAFCTGLNPFLAYYQVRMVHPFAWDMLLGLGLAYAAFSTDTSRRAPLLLLFALAGSVMLDRPTLGVFIVPFFIRERRWLLARQNAVLKVALIVLLLAPLGGWLARNHKVTGTLQLTSVTDQMIWMGLQEETEGSGHLPNGYLYGALLSTSEQYEFAGLDPAGRSRFFRNKWRSELAESRGLWLRMFVLKMKNFWLFRSNLGIGHGTVVGALAFTGFKIYAGSVLLLCLAAVALRDKALCMVLLPVFILSVVQCCFYFESRHRLLAEPLLLLVAVAILARLRGGWYEPLCRRSAAI